MWWLGVTGPKLVKVHKKARLKAHLCLNEKKKEKKERKELNAKGKVLCLFENQGTESGIAWWIQA